MVILAQTAPVKTQWFGSVGASSFLARGFVYVIRRRSTSQDMSGSWSHMDHLLVAGGDSESSSDEGASDDVEHLKAPEKPTKAGLKKSSFDFEALSKHGYSGGPSVLYVPKPNSGAEDQDWSWSCGKRKGENDGDEHESISERELTREVTNEGAIQAAAQAIAERNYAKKQRQEAAAEARALSFAQREKRKRNLGQSSRGKNYVEEEKRILRDQGSYSGFD